MDIPDDAKLAELQQELKFANVQVDVLNKHLEKATKQSDLLITVLSEEFTYHILRARALKRQLRDLGVDI